MGQRQRRKPVFKWTTNYNPAALKPLRYSRSNISTSVLYYRDTGPFSTFLSKPSSSTSSFHLSFLNPLSSSFIWFQTWSIFQMTNDYFKHCVWHSDTDVTHHPQMDVMRSETCSRDMCVFSKEEDLFTHGQKSCYVNMYFKDFDAWVSVWASVYEWFAIVCFPPFAIQAVSSHLSVLSSHCFRPSFLFFQTPAETCESIIRHWVITDCTLVGLRAFLRHEEISFT